VQKDVHLIGSPCKPMHVPIISICFRAMATDFDRGTSNDHGSNRSYGGCDRSYEHSGGRGDRRHDERRSGNDRYMPDRHRMRVSGLT